LPSGFPLKASSEFLATGTAKPSKSAKKKEVKDLEGSLISPHFLHLASRPTLRNGDEKEVKELKVVIYIRVCALTHRDGGKQLPSLPFSGCLQSKKRRKFAFSQNPSLPAVPFPPVHLTE
jgi:hypothetical protein